MRRGLRTGLGVVGLAGVATAALFMWPQPEKITKENWRRVRAGMTVGEVIAILGPPGDYRRGPTNWEATNHPSPDRGLFMMFTEPPTHRLNWQSDSVLLECDLSADDRVVSIGYMDTWRLEQSTLDNLVWRAKRQWRRWFPEN